MRANPDHHQKLGLDHPLGVGLWINQRIHRDRCGLLNFFTGAMPDEDRLAAPSHGDGLTNLNGADIHFDAGDGQDVGGRIHGVDQGPNEGSRANDAHGTCG